MKQVCDMNQAFLDFHHITPEIISQLNNKDPKAYQEKFDRIVGHTKEDKDDPMHWYSQGLGYFYLGDYEKCMERNEKAFPYFDDEMGIAAIFWHTLAAWRIGKRPSLLEDRYKQGMNVGHHVAYEKLMHIAFGKIQLGDALAALSEDMFVLDYVIYGFGLSCYVRHLGDCIKEYGSETSSLKYYQAADEILDKVVACRDFWIAYAWLAAWNDKKTGDK